MKEEANEEPLYDFKFANLFAKLEDVINNKEDVKPWDIMDAVWESVQGTNAQKVFWKFIKKFKKGHCGPLKAMKKAMKKAKEHARKNKRNADQANIPVDQRVHERITCDGCEKTPIVGIWYKCAECPNFDLCSQCEGQGLHDHHTFLKVKIPQGIEVHEPFRTAERGCKQKWNKKNDEGLKPVIDAAFEFPQVLEKLT